MQLFRMCVFSVENVESDCEALQGGDGSFLRMPFFLCYQFRSNHFGFDAVKHLPLSTALMLA